MLDSTDCPLLQLPNALWRQAELVTDGGQCPGLTVNKPIAHLEDGLLPPRQGRHQVDIDTGRGFPPTLSRIVVDCHVPPSTTAPRSTYTPMARDATGPLLLR